MDRLRRRIFSGSAHKASPTLPSERHKTSTEAPETQVPEAPDSHDSEPDVALVTPPRSREIAPPVYLSADRGFTEVLAHAGAGRRSRTVAALVAQIAFLQARAGGVRRDGEQWTRQTYDGLLRHMPGIKKRALRYAFDTGRRLGLIHTSPVRNGQLMRVDLAAVVGLCAEARGEAPTFATGQRSSPAMRWDPAIEKTVGRNASAVLYQVHSWTSSRHAVERVTPERGRELWARTTAARLADRLGLSESTVKRALARCRREGLLRPTKRLQHGMLLKPDYDAIRDRYGEDAPPWAANPRQLHMPALAASADIAEVLDEPAGVLETKLLEGMAAEEWINGPDDRRARTLRRELAGVDPPDGEEIAAAILDRARRTARKPVALTVHLVRAYKATGETVAHAATEEVVQFWDGHARTHVPADQLIAETLKRFDGVHTWDSVAGAQNVYKKDHRKFYDDIERWERQQERQAREDRKGGNRYF